MSRILFLPALAISAALLGACDGVASRTDRPPAQPVRVAQATPSSVPASERSQPIRWNETAREFEYEGQPLKAAKLWTFDDSTEGFVVTGGDARLTQGSGLSVTQSDPDPILRSPSGLNVDGSVNTLVLVRLTRAAPGQEWSGAVHYTTVNHGESAAFMALPVQGEDPAVNETTVLVYDMAHLKKGGPDWTQSIIDQLRFDFEDAPGGEFLVRQVAIARLPSSAVAMR